MRISNKKKLTRLLDGSVFYRKESIKVLTMIKIPVIINLVAAKHKHVTAMKKIKLIVDSKSVISYNKIAVIRAKVTLSALKK
ncbi:hypothetical protein APE02nite_21790 [Alkalibacterium pelagium]|nr:hypothetical protein APE02nite_21790 [Alkalibacterium pelagium]